MARVALLLTVITASAMPVTVEVPARPGVNTDPELTPNIEEPDAWVYFWEDGTPEWKRMAASILMYADINPFGLRVHVAAGHKAASFCMPDYLRSGHVAELGCYGLRDVPHDQIDSVSLEYGPPGLNDVWLNYSCIRHNSSDENTSTWACLLDECGEHGHNPLLPRVPQQRDLAALGRLRLQLRCRSTQRQ